MIELIRQAITMGAKMYWSISGGKDGQAGTKVTHNWGFPIEGLIHADLGKVEWEESLPMCQRQSEELNVPLFVVKRADGLGLLEYWQKRMMKLQGKGIPFWSSSASRYCTSDLKRGPINAFFTSTGHYCNAELMQSDEKHLRYIYNLVITKQKLKEKNANNKKLRTISVPEKVNRKTTAAAKG